MQGFGVFTVLKGLKAFQAKFVSSHLKKIMRFTDLFIPLTTVVNVIP